MLNRKLEGLIDWKGSELSWDADLFYFCFCNWCFRLTASERESELLGRVWLFASYSESCRFGRNEFVTEFYGWNIDLPNELTISATVLSVSKSGVSYQVHMLFTKQNLAAFFFISPFSLTSCQSCQWKLRWILYCLNICFISSFIYIIINKLNKDSSESFQNFITEQAI